MKNRAQVGFPYLRRRGTLPTAVMFVDFWPVFKSFLLVSAVLISSGQAWVIRDQEPLSVGWNVIYCHCSQTHLFLQG